MKGETPKGKVSFKFHACTKINNYAMQNMQGLNCVLA